MALRPVLEHPRLALVLAALVVVAFSLDLLGGRAPLSWLALLNEAWHRNDGPWRLILLEIRLPRALLALVIGATLGLAGAALQGFLRNPLAEPGLIGASATAGLGAVLAFYFGLAERFAYALPLGGMAGALVGVALVTLLAGRVHSALTVILAGVAVNSLAAALTALALNLAPSPYAALEIVFWLLGSVQDRSFDHLWLMLPFTALGWALVFACAPALDALALGEDAAQSLGFDLLKIKWMVVLGVGLAVGAAVAVAGSIGFVGLIVPHLLRPWVRQRPAALLPVSALGGAALLLAADCAARLAVADAELKLGVVTALVGAPFFLVLLLRLRRSLP